MSSATLGFIIGFLFGGLFGMIMLSVIITAGRTDEREQKLYEEYLRKKREEENRPTMNEVREAFGFPPVEQKEEDE